MKKTVALFFGGVSPEYSVSLVSAGVIARNIDQEKYNVIYVGITKEGKWYRYYGIPENIGDGTWCEDESMIKTVNLSMDRSAPGIVEYEGSSFTITHIDCAFPVMHGKNGEDGTFQGALALAGIPMVGCGVMASAVGMDKFRAHELAKASGIAVPLGKRVCSPYDLEECTTFAQKIGYPLFVKPIKAGSSYGITHVQKADELKDAINEALKYDDEVIIEQAVNDGYEVGCAILGNDELMFGEVDAVPLSDGFRDFNMKYVSKASAFQVPADFSPELTKRIKETAKRLYLILGCRGYARIDMFLNKDGNILFNEVNTIPGFSEHGRYPRMMNAAGLSYAQIVDRLIALALEGSD